MDTTVPVLAVISGDTDTLRRRRDAADRDLAAAARCVGRRLLAGDDHVDAGWRRMLAEGVERFDLVNGECSRRSLGFRMTYADAGPRW